MSAVRIGAAWAVLTVLGLASLWLNGNVHAAHLAFAVVIAVAGTKAMLVAWAFMHIGDAPRAWGLAFAAVIAALAAAIIVLRLAA